MLTDKEMAKVIKLADSLWETAMEPKLNEFREKIRELELIIAEQRGVISEQRGEIKHLREAQERDLQRREEFIKQTHIPRAL